MPRKQVYNLREVSALHEKQRGIRHITRQNEKKDGKFTWPIYVYHGCDGR
jgi:hypothetical protein